VPGVKHLPHQHHSAEKKAPRYQDPLRFADRC
jgi:hypothetical protein